MRSRIIIRIEVNVLIRAGGVRKKTIISIRIDCIYNFQYSFYRIISTRGAANTINSVIAQTGNNMTIIIVGRIVPITDVSTNEIVVVVRIETHLFTGTNRILRQIKIPICTLLNIYCFIVTT